MLLELPTSIDLSVGYGNYFKDEIWLKAAAEICSRHNLSYSNLRHLPEGENGIFPVDEKYVVKIFAPFRSNFEREKAALEFIGNKMGIDIPEIVYSGEIEGWSYLILTQLKGVASRELWAALEEKEKLEILQKLGEAARNLHLLNTGALSQTVLNRDWSEYVRQKSSEAVARQRACGANPEWLESLPDFLERNLKLLPAKFENVFLHGDIHAGNILLIQNAGRWQISGLLDLGDSFLGFNEYEFVAPGVLMMQGKSQLQREYFLAYGYKESELDAELRARLMLLTVLYECSDLRKYALRLAPEAVNFTLAELEKAIWKFVSD